MKTMSYLAVAIASMLMALAPSAAFAQSDAYPAKAIKIIVPFPPAGATDLMARNVALKLGENWKQPVVIENRPGASAMIGADIVAKSPADGYTILAATIIHAANATLYPRAPYQLQRDLQPVAITGLLPLIAVVRTESPIKSLQDLVAASHSRSLNAGSSGNGSAAHLGLELFNTTAGTKIQHVPYKGGVPAMTDLLGGQVDIIFALLPEAIQHVRSGKLRALAVTSDKRHPLLPDVPTTAEAGIAGVEVTSWQGLMVPAGTPRDIVSRINAEVTSILSTPEMKARIIEQGFQPVSLNVSETEKFVATDVQRWAKVIHEARITAD
jgi:tripartite-type tricarboxylate transporter receptor subunit TctC